MSHPTVTTTLPDGTELSVTPVEDGFEVHATRDGLSTEVVYEPHALNTGLLTVRSKPTRAPERQPIRGRAPEPA